MRFAIPLLVASALIGLAPAGSARGYDKPAVTKSEAHNVAATLEAADRKVNDAFQNRDAKSFLSMIDPNAWSVDAMGFTPVSKMVDMLKDVEIKNYSIEGYRVMKVDQNNYVALYTWKGQGSYKGQPFPPVAYCSTLWNKRGKEWKAIFHQESMAMEGAPQSAATIH
jgi:hypothetical protein